MTVFIQYAEPKKVPRRRIIPNMGVLGKQYRNKAKAIFEALANSTPTENGADVVVDGEKIHIPADLFEVRDEIIDVRGEDIVPHVIEPSYGIDRMCYAVLEQAYDEDTADGETRAVMRLLPEGRPGAGRGLPADDPRRPRHHRRRDHPHTAQERYPGRI